MKTLFVTTLTLITAAGALCGFTACGPDDGPAGPGAESPPQTADPGPDLPSAVRITVTVGGALFTATLSDNAAAAAFGALLPLSVRMSELNGNEKYFYLPDGLPADPARPGTVRAGDLMLYGSDCLVLFYRTFDTSYAYTRLGRLDDPSGLAAAAGAGGVNVGFARLPDTGAP